MKTKKHWYDYLWIAELIYFSLGFFNILFAWVGLCMFFIPLVLALAEPVLRQGPAVCPVRRQAETFPVSRCAGLASLPFLPLRFPGIFHGHVLQHASRNVACV